MIFSGLTRRLGISQVVKRCLGKLLIGMKINVWISDVCIINHHVIIRVKMGREFADGIVNEYDMGPYVISALIIGHTLETKISVIVSLIMEKSGNIIIIVYPEGERV